LEPVAGIDCRRREGSAGALFRARAARPGPPRATHCMTLSTKNGCSTSWSANTLKCNGALSVTVGNAKASKEVNFTVQHTSDGKTSVSVEPFQF
jgi:hypothetical protein